MQSRIVYLDVNQIILYFGQKNVLGTGWRSWTIASFTTFLACFVKLSVKSSSAAKLFNAVHKAQVSWKRIKPLMHLFEEQKSNESLEDKKTDAGAGRLEVKHLSFTYPAGRKILEDISFTAEPGQIIGITGAVACGKSTLGKVFLGECPYDGKIIYRGKDLQAFKDAERSENIGYLGHDPELFNDSLKNNVRMGDAVSAEPYFRAVCIDEEIAEMPDGKETLVGTGGVRLSGGQAQRLALARTLYHKRPVMILDDPFSALDKNTEKEIFAHLRQMTADSIVLLISHRLYLFPEMDQVIWMEDGRTTVGTHEELLEDKPEYAELFRAQTDAVQTDPVQEGGLEREESFR